MDVASRNRLAALRTKHRRRGLTSMPGGVEMPWQEALAQVVDLRRHADVLAFEAVVTARVSGASWDAISVALGGRPTGEALRQRYSRPVRERSNDA